MEGPTEIILDNILQRRSVRNFTGRDFDHGMLTILLKAAMAAPSARNRQPWAFIVVTEHELMDVMANGLPFTKMLYKAAAAIVVCGDHTIDLQQGATDLWYQDAAAASQNILLAAHALGLGAVWSALYPYEERSGLVKKTLGLPDHVTPFSIIPLGQPTGEDLPKDKYKPERIHWNKW